MPITAPRAFERLAYQVEGGPKAWTVFNSGLINIGVNTAFDTLQWADILGSIKFEGFSSENAIDPNIPELKWRVKPSPHAVAKLGKRDAELYMGHLARHDIRGRINSIQSTGLLASSPSSGKRSDPEIPVQQRKTADGDLYVAQIDEVLFKNDIHHEICGLDHVSRASTSSQCLAHTDLESSICSIPVISWRNKQNCYEFLNTTSEQINKRIAQSIDFADSPLLDFSKAIVKRYSSYTIFHGADVLPLNKEKLTAQLRSNLKNSLVSKAYSDEGCYVQCYDRGTSFTGPRSIHMGNIVCTSGCFDPILGGFEELYGFNDGVAERGPWDLNQTEITRVSWQAYKSGNLEGYLPGTMDLNPYKDHIKDHSPILPVCYSDIKDVWVDSIPRSGLLCSCGDKYGNETDRMLASVDWRSKTKKYEYQDLNVCLDRLAPQVLTNPGAYLISKCTHTNSAQIYTYLFLADMCNVFYKQLVPPGSGSHQGT